MRTIRIFAHVSADGVIAPGGPNDDSEYAHGGWTAPYRNPTGAAAVAEAQGTGYDLLLGRRTYDLWARYWPQVKGGPFADILNAATKYVVTHRPESLQWGPVGDLGADIVEGIRRLKSSDGPDLIVWGSTTVTSLLFEHGLVDDVVLCVYPVLLGRGKRFFSDSVAPRELAFVSTSTSPTGILMNTYRYVGAPLAKGA
jgi:dihydrofolate reductase